MTVKAIYENGVFRPLDAVSLPEHSEVEFEPRVVSHTVNTSPEGMDKIYEILGMRFDSGDPFGAQNHNEHQP